jgi:hypothetical protein
MSASEMARASFDEYASCRMRPNQTLLEFKVYFSSAVDNLGASGGYVPSPEVQAHDFVRWLRDEDFFHVKAEFANLQRRGGAVPATLDEAFSFVYAFVPPVLPSGKGAPRGPKNSAVFVAAQPAQSRNGSPKASPAQHKTSAEAAGIPSKAKSSTQTAVKAQHDMGPKPKCSHCGRSGHRAETCYDLHPELRPERGKAAWVGIQQSVQGSERVIVDSGCNVGVFGNRELLTGIRNCNPMPIEGVNGWLTVSQCGDWGRFRVYHHPDFGTNLIPFRSLTKKCNRVVTYAGAETDKGVEFHLTDGTVITGKYQDDILILESPKAFVATVGNNEARLNQRELLGARRARRLQEILGFPPTADLLAAVRYGFLSAMDVTTADVARSEVVYGAHQHALAGRTTSSPKAPITFVNGTAEVATQRLYCDVFYVDGAAFLMAVAKPLNLIITSDLSDGRNYSSKEFAAALDDSLRVLTTHGFTVEMVYTDGEGLSKGASSTRPTDVSGAGDHVPIAERAIRMIEERVTALRASLPFRLSRGLNKYLVQYITQCVNLFPSVLDMDKRSPRERLTGVRPSLKSYRDLAFGDYCHVSAELTPAERRATTHARTVGAIAIGPTFNANGSWNFISLESGRVLRRTWWKLLPTPDDVITKINSYSVSPAAYAELPRVRQPSTSSSIAVNGGRIGNYYADLQDDSDEEEEEADVPPPTPNRVQVRSISPTVSVPPISSELRSSEFDEGVVESANETVDAVVMPSSALADYDDDVNVDELHDENTEPAVPVLRRSERIRLQAHHASLKSELELYGQEGRAAVVAELDQLIDKCVFSMIETSVNVKSCIPSKGFVKPKRNANGLITKYKARVAAGGHRQVVPDGEDNSSPTVYTESSLVLLAVSAAKGHKLATLDVEGAFLECDIDREMFMRLPKDLTEVLIGAHPQYSKFVRPDGGIVVKLNKALYGTIQASRLWYNKLSGILVEDGFRMNDYDKCLFYKRQGNENIMLALHVDDVLISSTSAVGIDYCVGLMRKSFRAITVSRDEVLEYLGMRISNSSTGIKVTMPGFAEECVLAFSEHEPVGKASTPSDANLFDIDESSEPLSSDRSVAFRSLVAKVQYLAMKVRPDILPTVSHLASRVTKCTVEDWSKLKRLFSYLSNTLNYGLSYKRGEPVALTAYIDASHATHMEDGTSRTGVVIMLAGGVVCSKSFRQSIVTTSSTEAELVALTEGTNHLLWLRNVLSSLQLTNLGPSVVFQDNMSTIALVTNDKTKQQRTRHLNCKYFAVRQRINESSIVLQHLSGTDMLADVLTKSVDRSTLHRLLPRMMYLEDN